MTDLIFSALLIAMMLMAYRQYAKNKVQLCLTIIVFICLLLKLYSSKDQYLHAWDERYHALVAKHLAEHPLTPTVNYEF